MFQTHCIIIAYRLPVICLLIVEQKWERYGWNNIIKRIHGKSGGLLIYSVFSYMMKLPNDLNRSKFEATRFMFCFHLSTLHLILRTPCFSLLFFPTFTASQFRTYHPIPTYPDKPYQGATHVQTEHSQLPTRPRTNLETWAGTGCLIQIKVFLQAETPNCNNVILPS